MKFIVLIGILLLMVFFLIPLVSAETTFFDQDDAFIMGDFPTTPTTGQVTGGGGCRYEWNCTNWSECLPSGKQIRNCTNIGTCSDTYKTPEMEQNCTYTAPEGEEGEESEKEEKRAEEQEEVGGIIGKGVEDKDKILVFSIIILIIISIIIYWKRSYFKKLYKNNI